MRRFMVVAAVLTAFSQSASVAYGDVISRPAPPNTTPPPLPPPQNDLQGLCRRAPALVQLAQEVQTPNEPTPRPSRWSPRAGAPTSATPPPPPPPPPPPRVGGEVSTSAETVRDAATPSPATASASKRAPGDASARFASPSRGAIASPRERPRQQAIQSGQLTAGEHDDLLNPSLYARYVDKFLAGETLSGVPRVDTGKALSIVVTDNRGAPAPFATVTLTCSDGNRLSLTSMADGRVVFFPALDRLGSSVMMTASLDQGRQTGARRINIADVANAQVVRTQLPDRAAQIGKFDLAVVIDATGSMGDEIAFLKAELADIIATLGRRHRGLDIRVALVVYRDQGDEFVTRTFEFTSNMAQVQSNLSAQSAGGGGDMPEAMEVAMTRAVGLNWRPDAVKSMLLVADAPPHSGDVPMTWAATEAARAKRIQIVPVAASGVDDAAQYIMRAMAAATQSRYAFLTDDSGIGNAHAEPSVDCYHVTKLDSLIARILDAQISGRRIEPTQSEIVRTVGDYDNGRCRGA
jgi:Mg-chelatase subunit ChlD